MKRELTLGVLAATLLTASIARAEVRRLTTEHVDLRVIYTAEGADHLHLVMRDEDHGLNYPADEVVLVVSEAAKLTLPGGTPFGDEGDPLHILPQSQDRDLLYLGISTEGIPGGVFDGNLRVRLKSLSGPGRFYVWQASSFGDFKVKMDTADGISDADGTAPLTGSHEHYNWGFTAPGIYQVTFQATGRRIGDTEDIVSPKSTFTFHVLPLPTEAALLRVIQVTTAGDLQMEVTGSPGTTCHLEASGDLSRWTPLTNVTLTGTTAIVTMPAAGPARFARALVP